MTKACFARSGPAFSNIVKLQASHRSTVPAYGNEQTDQLSGKTLRQSVLKLDKMEVSQAVTGKLCREEGLEWENNPIIHRI